jgi:hypothetical protein
MQREGPERLDKKHSEFRLDESVAYDENWGLVILYLSVLAMNSYRYRCAGRKDKDNLKDIVSKI